MFDFFKTMKNKTVFIFAWRLTVEKWFDIVLWLCEDIVWTTLEESIHLHIFGSWSLQNNIPHYSFITYHWFQTKDVVMQTRKKCHYCLVPSRFLETFGLTALDSISLWVPVVWYKKWWLAQFGEGVIQIPENEKLYKHIKSIINSKSEAEYSILSKKCIWIAKEYSWQNRKNQFETSLWRPIQWSKIMLVSDYTNNIGGIESYIQIVSNKLKEFGAKHVSIVWADVWNATVMRYILLLFSPYNFIIKNRLKKLIKNTNYDLIWRHSVQRFVWPAPIRFVSKKTHSLQWIMTHDFGLYHPFPSQVYSEDQLIDSNSFLQRMEAGYKCFGSSLLYKILRSVPLFLKYLSSKKIKKELAKNIDTFLVPSVYMKNILQNQYKKDVIVKTLSHVI